MSGGSLRHHLDRFGSRLRHIAYRTRAGWSCRWAGGLYDINRSVRFAVPVRMDGKGIVRIESSVRIGYSKAPRFGSGEVLLQARMPRSNVHVATDVVLSNNVSIIAFDSVEIGSKSLVGDSVLITDCDAHEVNPSTRRDSPGPTKPVKIGENVWIGSRSIVLKGCDIGENSVIGAGSIVTRPIPANVVAAGSPAVVLREI